MSAPGSEAAVSASAAGAAAFPRLTALQWRVILLCALVALFDGFDTQAIGPAAKAISSELSVPMGRFGLVFSATQVGFILGAMAFGALGDRFGRKPLLIAGALTFAVCSLGTAQAHSFDALLAFRFLSGVGLGGASPNFISLAGAHAPPAQRARVITSLWAAVPFGGMCAAFLSAVVLPALGWRAMFQIGFAAPLLLGLVLLWALPGEETVAAATAAARQPVAELFTRGRRAATTWLWLGSFMTWTGLIVMAFWTPALLQKAGWSAPAAASVLALNNAGGVLGTLLTGAALARIRPLTALMATLALGGVFIAAIGLSVGQHQWLPILAAIAGFFASAAGGSLLAVSAATYPENARATGVGWALGVGRVGAVVGPAGAGLLVAAGWGAQGVYLALAVPFGLACLFIACLGRTAPRSSAPSPT